MENNIPAFPLYAQDIITGHLSKEDGMTLLDYMAGQALAGRLAAIAPYAFTKTHLNSSPKILIEQPPQCWTLANNTLSNRHNSQQ